MLAVFYALFQGLQLGIYTITVSSVLDHTLSAKYTQELMKKDLELYFDGMKANYKNLLVISPLFYAMLYLFLMNHNKDGFYIFDYSGLVLLHNIGYYLVHKNMHKLSTMKFLKDAHGFHHRFINTIPSTGNAVSPMEFNLAYVSPFIMGIYLISPNNITLKCAIMTISLLNIAIHCPNLSDLELPPYLVSPMQHMNHHKKAIIETYAAPFLNIDYIIDEANKLYKIHFPIIQDDNTIRVIDPSNNVLLETPEQITDSDENTLTLQKDKSVEEYIVTDTINNKKED